MSFIQLQVDEQAAARLARELGAAPAQVRRANNRAVRKAVRWASSQVARAISRRHDIPLGVLTGSAAASRVRARAKAAGTVAEKASLQRAKRRGQRIFTRLPDKNSAAANVWVGTEPVQAAYLGRPRQTRHGVRVGRRNFPGAFIVQIGNHTGVYRRAGKARLPLEPATIDLSAGNAQAAAVQRQVPRRMLELLDQELNYEINVRGRR